MQRSSLSIVHTWHEGFCSDLQSQASVAVSTPAYARCLGIKADARILNYQPIPLMVRKMRRILRGTDVVPQQQIGIAIHLGAKLLGNDICTSTNFSLGRNIDHANGTYQLSISRLCLNINATHRSITVWPGLLLGIADGRHVLATYEQPDHRNALAQHTEEAQEQPPALLTVPSHSSTPRRHIPPRATTAAPGPPPPRALDALTRSRPNMTRTYRKQTHKTQLETSTSHQMLRGCSSSGRARA